MTVRFYAADHKVFGPGIAQLLHRVQEYHSLRAAALSMDMAYSKAWTVLRTAEEQLMQAYGAQQYAELFGSGSESAE